MVDIVQKPRNSLGQPRKPLSYDQQADKQLYFIIL